MNSQTKGLEVPASKRSFFKLCAHEPFRIFFPLGTLVGLSGVSLWPLFFSGIHRSFYPGIMHARMMVEGFLGAFAFGFLGTAFPRLVGAKPLSVCDLRLLIILYILSIGAHIAEQPLSGDVVFLILLLSFLAILLNRFRNRRDMPPPGFAVVAPAFVAAVAGVSLSIAAPFAMNADLTVLGNALLNQAWFNLLLLGLSGFLIARFLGHPRPEFPERRSPSPEWNRQAALALGCGGMFLASYVIDVFHPAPRLLAVIRWIVAAGYLALQFPLLRLHPLTTVAFVLRLGVFAFIASLLFPLAWPAQQVAGLHLTFLGGLTLIIISVATRVVLGHSGQHDRLGETWPTIVIAVLFISAASALRVLGDFHAVSRPTWLTIASYLWMLGTLIWGWSILTKVRTPDPEGDYQE